MMIIDEFDRAAEEESPGPSEPESVLLEDTLKDVPFEPVPIIDEQVSLSEAIHLMRTSQQPCVLVTSKGKLSGIFTGHDVLMKIMETAMDLERTPVSACMTPNPASLPLDAGVAYALNRMVVDGLHRLPLVDAVGRPAGVVSMRDIIGYLSSFFPRKVLNLPPDPAKIPIRREGA